MRVSPLFSAKSCISSKRKRVRKGMKTRYLTGENGTGSTMILAGREHTPPMIFVTIGFDGG
jgi:hypothetical protein